MKLNAIIASVAGANVIASAPPVSHPESLPPRTTVITEMRQVNDYWVHHFGLGAADWLNSTYYLGALAYYGVSHDSGALQRTEQWASAHGYRLEGGPTTRYADSQAAGQVYIDLYVLLHGKSKLDQIATSLNRMMNSTRRDDWWWIDATFMSMPAFAHYGALTQNQNYWRTAYQLFHYPKNVLHLQSPGRLFYRDQAAAKILQLWNRGNGWAIAAQALDVNFIPHDNPLAAESVATLRDMASRLRVYQRSDGFWPVDLRNRQSDPESSGTALDAFAIAYGIRVGILDRASYLPMLERAWAALNSAVKDGRLGDVQGVAGAPGPVDPANTAAYGVGAFLLAGSQIARM